MQAYEKDLALLREGVEVTIRSEAYPQEALKGKVDFLGQRRGPGDPHHPGARQRHEPGREAAARACS